MAVKQPRHAPMDFTGRGTTTDFLHFFLPDIKLICIDLRGAVIRRASITIVCQTPTVSGAPRGGRYLKSFQNRFPVLQARTDHFKSEQKLVRYFCFKKEFVQNLLKGIQIRKDESSLFLH